MPMILHRRLTPAPQPSSYDVELSGIRARGRTPVAVGQNNGNNNTSRMEGKKSQRHQVPSDLDDGYDCYYDYDDDNHHQQQQYHHYQPQEAPPALEDEDCCDKDHRRGLCKNLEAWYKLVDSASTASTSTSSTSIRSLSGGCFQSAVSGWGSVASRKSYACLRSLDSQIDHDDASSMYWSAGDENDSIASSCFSSGNYSEYLWGDWRHRREQVRFRQCREIARDGPLPPTSSLSLQHFQHPRNQYYPFQSEEEEILAFLQYREHYRTYVPPPEPQVVEWGYFVDTPLEMDQPQDAQQG